MVYKGVVTNVDTTYLFFELDGNVKVHMSILISQNTKQALPLVGTEVVIEHAHNIRSRYFLCECAIFRGDFHVSCQEHTFLKLVQEHKFGIADLLKVEEIINLIENNFKDLEKNLKIKVINSVLRKMISLSKHIIRHEDHMCLNDSISHRGITTSNSCKYVEIQSEKFSDFPHWSFGIHCNHNNALLFGFLGMHPMYGFLLLRDKHYQIPCIFYNISSEKFSKIQDSFVAIDKYKVITEIYGENNVPNMEYLLINLGNANIIYTEKPPGHIYLFGDEKPSGRSFKTNMRFQLKRKSMIRIGASNAAECWFQILILNVNGKESSEEAFLILPSAYVKIVVNFKEEMYYTLFHNMALKVVNHTELTRVKKLKVYVIQEDNGYFLKNDGVLLGAENILTVGECKNYILKYTDLVSFQGTLKSKRFADALPSYTEKKTKIYGFGTPGSKVHQLVFSCNEGNAVKYLDCYLNNWENVLMPLGLIPQMRVIVRNVYPQSRKYVKSSVFTTFEIISYDPLLPFTTVNLYENDHLDWGERFYLGCGNKLPYGVLIWGKVTYVQILSLKITNRCAGCKGVKECSGKCIHCGQSTGTELHFLIKMHVSDEFGQSKIIAKFPSIMKTILNLQEPQFRVWLKAIEEIGCFEYSLFEEQTFDSAKPELICFKRCLTNFLEMVNKQAILFLDLKCRKLDSNPQRNGGRPLWLCVEARKS